MPDGGRYAVNAPSLLAWVHLTETTCFLDAWIRYAEPGMSIADQDCYFVEMARIAEALGAEPIPRSRSEARRLLVDMRPQLRSDERTREVARIVLTQPAPSALAEPLQAIMMHAAIDLMPEWARHMYGLHLPIVGRAPVRASTSQCGWRCRAAWARATFNRDWGMRRYHRTRFPKGGTDRDIRRA